MSTYYSVEITESSEEEVIEVKLPSGNIVSILIPVNYLEEHKYDNATYGLNLVFEGHYE